MQVECFDFKVTLYVCLYKYNNLRTAEWIFSRLDINFKITWCGYKITGLMLEHFLFKKLHNRNVTLDVLPSPIPTALHVDLPLLETMLQVVFW